MLKLIQKQCTVKDIVNQLMKANPSSKFEVMVNDVRVPFELAYSGADGGSLKDADSVLLMCQSNPEREDYE